MPAVTRDPVLQGVLEHPKRGVGPAPTIEIWLFWGVLSSSTHFLLA